MGKRRWKTIGPGDDLAVENTDGAVVTGNTVTTNGAPLWKLWDATIKNATLSPNTVDGRTA
jgi:hypothetical protein